MPRSKDATLVEMPAALRDLIARERLHPRHALHEIIEESFFFWLDSGGWKGIEVPLRDW